MKRAHMTGEFSAFSEMAIVDTFTKLIFGGEDTYDKRELLIIKVFRAVDPNVVFDSHRDMGEYLKDLGVREMIKLVSRVQSQLMQEVPVRSEIVVPQASGALGRRVH